MCGGPTQAQQQLQAEQADFYKQATEQQAQVYAEDQQILQAMEGIYEPILQKGPNQEGFSTEELNSLNTEAVEGTAQNYAGAAKAVNENLAAEGGGTVSLPSGGATQLKAEVAAAAAGQESSEENQIKQADYAQGYSEWQDAARGLATEQGFINPVAYSGAATNAGAAEGVTANEIAQENDSWINAAIGASGTIGGAVVNENPGNIFA